MDITSLATPTNILVASGAISSLYVAFRITRWIGSLFTAGAFVGRAIPRLAFPLSMAGAGAAVDFASSNPDHGFAALGGAGALALVAATSFLRTFRKQGDEVRPQDPFRG